MEGDHDVKIYYVLNIPNSRDTFYFFFACRKSILISLLGVGNCILGTFLYKR